MFCLVLPIDFHRRAAPGPYSDKTNKIFFFVKSCKLIKYTYKLRNMKMMQMN